MQYNGGKKLIAPKIAEAIMRYNGGSGTCFEPFAGGGSVTEMLAPRFARYLASDVNPLTVGALLAPRTGFRFYPGLVSEEYYYRVKTRPHGNIETGAVAFGLSFGGKQWGGVARPIEKYARAFNNWADRFEFVTRHVAFACMPYESITDLVSPGDVVYCDPPYFGTTGYKTGKFDSDAFFDWCRLVACRGASVFVSEEKTPFTLVAEFSRPTNTNGNSSGRPDRLWSVGLEAK